MSITREEAWGIVCEHVQSDSLRKHMLSVEAAMRWYAPQYGGNPEEWGMAGLLHDFDWEIHPTLEQHPQAGSAILRERGVSEDMIQTVLSHAPHTGVARDNDMRKALFACDEITGLITAAVLVRPSKSIMDLKVKSVKKKWKTKAFAAGVNREDVEIGAAEMGIELWAHVGNVITAMQAVAPDLGLDGALATEVQA